MRNLPGISKTLTFILMVTVVAVSSFGQDFSTGDLTGWKSIGAVSVVPDTYVPSILSGNAALVSTESGAVPIEQVVAFLESEGIYTQGKLFDELLNHPGAVGSALVADFTTTSEAISVEAYALSNNKLDWGHDRGGACPLGQGF